MGGYRCLWPTASAAAKPLVRAVRAVPVRIITIGKGSSVHAQALASEWADKVRRYTQLSEIQVKGNPKRASDTAAAVDSEAERVLKLLTGQDRVIVLDEKGRDLSSEGMAKLVAEAGDMGVRSLTFCIGGPFGHGQAVKDRADVSLKLSSMVLNHQIAHLVLLEQIYRSWTILRGEPYHH